MSVGCGPAGVPPQCTSTGFSSTTLGCSTCTLWYALEASAGMPSPAPAPAPAPPAPAPDLPRRLADWRAALRTGVASRGRVNRSASCAVSSASNLQPAQTKKQRKNQPTSQSIKSSNGTELERHHSIKRLTLVAQAVSLLEESLAGCHEEPLA